MLYDPKWEVQTKPDVFSLESLIAWLEKQPADGRYCYFDTGGCLLHKYFEAMGIPIKSVGGTSYDLKTGEVGILGIAFAKISCGPQGIAPELRHTYGQALDRARDWASRA